MQVNPYLTFNGNCADALKFYQKVLGAQIEASFPFGEGPPEMKVPAEWKDKIMHAKITIDGEIIMASDAPPGHFQQPQGFSVSLQVEDAADAERRFKALSEGEIRTRNRFRAGSPEMQRGWEFWARRAGCGDMLADSKGGV